MKTAEQLRASSCRPLRAGAMTDAEIRAQLGALPDWTFEAGSIRRLFRFRDYYETMAFVNALAFVAHSEDHHPELVVRYNQCEAAFSTHSVGGVSENDFICAAKADALYARRAPSPSA